METKPPLDSPRQLSETQQLRLQVLLRDVELLNIRSRDLLIEFRATLCPAPSETVFNPQTMKFQIPDSISALAPQMPQ